MLPDGVVVGSTRWCPGRVGPSLLCCGRQPGPVRDQGALTWRSARLSPAPPARTGRHRAGDLGWPVPPVPAGEGFLVASRTRGPLLAAGLALYFAAIRPRLLGWGATRQERRQPLPGDDLVPARWQTTRAITICAPADEVWPWLAQMGYGRGGWYSYDWLERRVGAGEFAEGGSARRVIPELQLLKAGDTVALSQAGGLTVAVLDPPEALVLHYRMGLLTAAPARQGDRAIFDWTWAFVLTPVDERSCRLVVRVRVDYRPRWLLPLLPFLLEPAHFIMERKMLKTIGQRARRLQLGVPASAAVAQLRQPPRSAPKGAPMLIALSAGYVTASHDLHRHPGPAWPLLSTSAAAGAR